MSKTRISRRTLLRGAGGIAVALPFLDIMRPKRAEAQTAGPKRFITFVHRQGTMMEEWRPTGTETSFTLPYMLSMLDPYKAKITVIHGCGNGASHYLGSDDHNRAVSSLLTGRGYGSGAPGDKLSDGPSIDQAVAARIGTTTRFRSHNAVIGNVGGPERDVQTGLFHRGADDPIRSDAHPSDSFNRLFAGFDPGAQQEIDRLSARRKSVLDAVTASFADLRGRLGTDDRARLDAHATKIRELETRITAAAPVSSCTRPTVNLPANYNFSHDDDVTGPLHFEIMVMAMACDLTRVGTIAYDNWHAPLFPFLSVNGGPIVPSTFDVWHTMVHSGRTQPGLRVAFRWYGEQFALLIKRLSEVSDANGPLLDSSLVMWISEFGNGGVHNRENVPIVLVGNTGRPNGRFLNFPGKDYGQLSDNDVTQLYVSILRAFGGTDTHFGRAELPNGPLAVL